MRINPITWLDTANRRRPQLSQTTAWFDGTVAPFHVGWYERHFTDSEIIGAYSMQYWNDEYWAYAIDAKPHWRQVGEYPAWRGLNAPSTN